jgi:hypothetical protein
MDVICPFRATKIGFPISIRITSTLRWSLDAPFKQRTARKLLALILWIICKQIMASISTWITTTLVVPLQIAFPQRLFAIQRCFITISTMLMLLQLREVCDVV